MLSAMYATTALRTTLMRRSYSAAAANSNWQRFWAWTLQQRAFVLISDDGGKTWSRSGPLPLVASETAVAQLDDGSILAKSRLGENGWQVSKHCNLNTHGLRNVCLGWLWSLRNLSRSRAHMAAKERVTVHSNTRRAELNAASPRRCASGLTSC